MFYFFVWPGLSFLTNVFYSEASSFIKKIIQKFYFCHIEQSSCEHCQSEMS